MAIPASHPNQDKRPARRHGALPRMQQQQTLTVRRLKKHGSALAFAAGARHSFPASDRTLNGNRSHPSRRSRTTQNPKRFHRPTTNAPGRHAHHSVRFIRPHAAQPSPARWLSHHTSSRVSQAGAGPGYVRCDGKESTRESEAKPRVARTRREPYLVKSLRGLGARARRGEVSGGRK